MVKERVFDKLEILNKNQLISIIKIIYHITDIGLEQLNYLIEKFLIEG